MMMRQTAAFQISIDLDDEPLLRWRVLNAAAPYVTAIFANSPVHDGVPTGYRSTRAAGLARSRSARAPGCRGTSDRPVEAYLEFALAAPAMLLPAVGGRHLPVRRLARARASRRWRSGTST